MRILPPRKVPTRMQSTYCTGMYTYIARVVLECIGDFRAGRPCPHPGGGVASHHRYPEVFSAIADSYFI